MVGHILGTKWELMWHARHEGNAPWGQRCHFEYKSQQRRDTFFFSGLFLLIVSGIEKILNVFYWVNEWVDKTNHLAASLNSLMTFRLTGSRCFSEKSLLFGPQHGLPQTSFARGTSFLSSHRFWCCSLCIFFLNRKHVPLTGLLGLAPYHSIFLPPSQC